MKAYAGNTICRLISTTSSRDEKKEEEEEEEEGAGAVEPVVFFSKFKVVQVPDGGFNRVRLFCKEGGQGRKARL